MSYHQRIMNIPFDGTDRIYKLGHRDARHAAAEIANEADAEVERLTAERDNYQQAWKDAVKVSLGIARERDEARAERDGLAADMERIRALAQGIIRRNQGGYVGDRDDTYAIRDIARAALAALAPKEDDA